MAASTKEDNPASRQPASTLAGVTLSNAGLVRWMGGLALRHPVRVVSLLSLNVVILAMSLSCLSLVGLEFDIIRHAVDPTTPPPRAPLGLPMPADGSAVASVSLVAGAIALVALIQAGLRYTAALAQALLIQSVLTRLRNRVYDKLQRLSFRFFDGNETGSLINRATGDCTAIATFSDFAIIQFLMLVITLLVNLVYMVHIHVGLTLVSLCTVPVMLVISVGYARHVRPAYEENRRLYDGLIRTLAENAMGQHVVKGFELQDAEVAKFRAANDAYRAQQRWLFRRVSMYNAVIGYMTQINLIIVLLMGGYLVIRKEIALGTGLIVFTNLLQSFSNQVVNMAGIANTLQASLTAAGRVYEVLAAPLEIQSPSDALPLPRARGEVVFENVTFGYRADEPVLREVTLRVKPGQCVAILGATGAGKSTLLSLLPRFYDPQRGRVLIDGQEVKRFNLDDLRRNIGLVFQESFLFSNTVAANIAFGSPHATREQIERAAKIAAAHEFIMELPKGYDTVVGEYGAGLSGGQRQRLAIARAVLLEPSILILDDATAAIDPETEHEILQAMDNAMRGRTTFVVAHRLSTLRRADFVVVLGQGRIMQTGTHEQLMQARGHYQDVANLQVVDSESAAIIQAYRWYEGEAPSLLEGDESPGKPPAPNTEGRA